MNLSLSVWVVGGASGLIPGLHQVYMGEALDPL